MSATPSALRRRLGAVMLTDERRLRRRIDRAGRRRDPDARAAALAALDNEVAAAEARIAQRRARVPEPAYPASLPITAALGDLRSALAAHQVVVVAGETGSGKSTQLPKLCLELGRGVRGMIGHTQPRRLAARAVASRIAEEVGADLGDTVGYRVRFTDETSPATLVKVLTDGMLLAETRGDPSLRAYDTIIVDEAHERSLTIDFLLGYLAELLPRRRDLKVVITSATIDTGRFASHFDAPIVEVSGRSYPVEIRNRPVDEDEQDVGEAIAAAVDELSGCGPGDILVFLPGERDIRETATLLGRTHPALEVLPLYARLSPAEQQRVFASHTGRRVVLATNVAETSLTVPSIRYVIDVGLARISRFSQRTKVQRLPIEKISQASALQRAGRCGRVADGVCIRLYSEEDFVGRPAFTEPEILRTNLAAVVLQMTALGFGDVAAFRFVDPPERRSVRAAAALLHELGAIDRPAADGTQQLTDVGSLLARLPVDPRIGRMLVAAAEEGCLRELLVLAAALSIADPRLRPVGQEDAADAAHARFDGSGSDFLALLELWRYVRELRRGGSAREFRARCREEFLHVARIREWQDLHAQLREAVGDEGLEANDTPAEPHAIHRAVLAGLLTQIGVARSDRAGYDGTRGSRFVLWPGSALAGSRPGWVMAAELVETSRLFARTVAAIDPAWVEQLGAHLLTRTYGEPRWDRRRGAAVTTERVALSGVVLAADRTVGYDRVDAEHARRLFIERALVAGDWDAEPSEVRANRRRLAELAELGDRLRRPGVGPDPDHLAAHYDRVLPDDVVDAASLQGWLRASAHRARLRCDDDTLLGGRAPQWQPADFPSEFPAVHTSEAAGSAAALPLTYRFAPGEPDDGVAVTVPLAALAGLAPWTFDWHVPGRRHEVVVELLRGLPKAVRRELVGLSTVAADVCAELGEPSGPLPHALSAALRRVRGVTVAPEACDLAALPDHLRPLIRVVHGSQLLGQGRDLPALQRRFAGQAHRLLEDAATDGTHPGARAWAFGRLPATVEVASDGLTVTGYPALVDRGEKVTVEVCATAAEQRRHLWAGTRRLLRFDLPLPARLLDRALTRQDKLVLARNPHGAVADLLEDTADAAVDALLIEAGGPVRDEASFARLRRTVAAAYPRTLQDVLADVRSVLEQASCAEERLAARRDAHPEASSDAAAHLAALVRPGFVTETGAARLADLTRYVEGIAVRLEALARNPQRDARRRAELAPALSAYAALRADPVAGRSPEAHRIAWQIEELRLSLFAEKVGVAERVSVPRVLRAVEDALGSRSS